MIPLENTQITLFTDGSSRGNPGPGGWAAIALYPKADGEMRVDELGGREEHTTNNRMEMTAALSALRHFSDFYEKDATPPFVVYSDSSYLVNGMTKWIYGWKKNNWISSEKKPVLNADIWKELIEVSTGKKISWKQVKGHANNAANNRCDEIATSFSAHKSIELFKGAFAGYSIDMMESMKLSASSTLLKSSSSSTSSKNKNPYSYISMIDGKIETHKTWDETEKRVKGKSGAKFKKTLNKADEESLIISWKALS